MTMCKPHADERSARTLPGRSVGLGLKPEHADDILGNPRQVEFFEIHAENYMGDGGPPHRLLERIRRDYPISIHGVGLSIGGATPLDRVHLQQLKRLIDRYQPALFSEHLAWSSHEGVFLNDLLPLPYNRTSLSCVCAHIDEVQEALGLRMLLENPSTYVAFSESTMTEVEFLRSVAGRTGCGLLLDVSNVVVSSVNHGFDAAAYVDAFPLDLVGEVHLGGFAEDRDSDGERLLIDDHGRSIAEAAWSLYGRVMTRGGDTPTLIEWDNDVPAFAVLAGEAKRARSFHASLAERVPVRAAA
jgi:uncharacterized protein (UPF0276 family)